MASLYIFCVVFYRKNFSKKCSKNLLYKLTRPVIVGKEEKSTELIKCLKINKLLYGIEFSSILD